MRQKGKHFTYYDRLRIEYLYNDGNTYRKIAHELNAAVSTVHAEVKKGLYLHADYEWKQKPRYSADIAQQYAQRVLRSN